MGDIHTEILHYLKTSLKNPEHFRNQPSSGYKSTARNSCSISIIPKKPKEFCQILELLQRYKEKELCQTIESVQKQGLIPARDLLENLLEHNPHTPKLNLWIIMPWTC